MCPVKTDENDSGLLGFAGNGKPAVPLYILKRQRKYRIIWQ